MWLRRAKITDEEELKEFDADERTSKAYMGNFSQAKFALLNEYWSITDKDKQADFLELHRDEIGVNPRQEYLRTRPKENALLAIWGQAQLLTKEAYTEFNKLIKELDIPIRGISELTLPPEGSIDTHFKYEEMVSEGNYNGPEAKLLLLEDFLKAQESGVQSYAEWHELEIPDEQLEYYQLRVDNKELFDKLEQVRGDEEALASLRSTKVGDKTFRDIERRVEAIGKGTREHPVPPEIVNSYVEHMQIVDETSGGSAEAKLNRYDNPELNEYLMNEGYHGEGRAEPLEEDREYLDNYLVPRWRLDVKYRAEDAEYDTLETTEERRIYLEERTDYRLDRRRREALAMSNSTTGERFPVSEIENFVNYHELPVKGFRQERFLLDNPWH
jgi:hypothetical protein